ncbi:MAG: hypothetical protein K6L76_05460 [Agarilytica sp.]
MSDDIEKLKYDNDQMLMQLGWLLERVVVKNGEVELPDRALDSKDILNSMNELKQLMSETVEG